MYLFFIYDIKKMTKLVGASSLFFLSLNGTYRAMGFKKRNNIKPQFADHCFTGNYPIDVSEMKQFYLTKNEYKK